MKGEISSQTNTFFQEFCQFPAQLYRVVLAPSVRLYTVMPGTTQDKKQVVETTAFLVWPSGKLGRIFARTITEGLVHNDGAEHGQIVDDMLSASCMVLIYLPIVGGCMLQGPLSSLWKQVPLGYSNYIIGAILSLALLMLLIAKFTSRSAIPPLYSGTSLLRRPS